MWHITFGCHLTAFGQTMKAPGAYLELKHERHWLSALDSLTSSLALMPLMITKAIALGLALLAGGIASTAAWAQGAPPVCSQNRYGTSAQAAVIELEMQTGTLADVQRAVAAAQRTRGLELGCAEASYAYGGTSTAAPTSAQIESAWAVHAASATQALAIYDRCPAIGRGAGAYMLGGWLARSGGLAFSSEPLLAIAENLAATQYLATQTPGRQATWAGLFAYARSLGEPASTCWGNSGTPNKIAIFLRHFPVANISIRLFPAR